MYNNYNNNYYQTHSEKNTREIEQSKIKNTVKSINDIYLSTLNTYATLTILLKDLKLELEKIQIETLEKFEDLDYLKNKNSSKPYDFYESLKKNISDEKKKGNEGNIFSFSLNTIKEQIDSLKKEFSNKKYASYKNNFEKFQKDALKMKKKEIGDNLFVNPSEAILKNCNIF